MDPTMAFPTENHSSPKRKRLEDSTTMLQLQTSLVPRFAQTHPETETGDNSPRTHVAGRFQRLNLENSEFNQHSEVHSREAKRIAQSTDDEPSSSLLQHKSLSEVADGMFRVSDSTSSPKATSSSSTSGQSSHLSPPTQPIKRSKSPSLNGEISDQFWHESEITGHDPDDPTDDGYGINGIGFKATPAIAWARSQKRKQQLADYRSREAREARQRRSERRRFGSGESSTAPTATEDTSKTKVRFDNG